jgi:hypothetical protein
VIGCSPGPSSYISWIDLGSCKFLDFKMGRSKQRSTLREKKGQENPLHLPGPSLFLKMKDRADQFAESRRFSFR